ncbi:hypothetical protein [Amycolatopsis suaedae]|uniref:Nucleotide exchange factor GrpE n=1 Tax=Amycolatopsis suaedae TaxID=2510978 RepID=A0A4Q7IZK8_9PSEU|nr:hypothetical protein [Amycolatopsis suaedae]RZQ60491.1 hypothetical protein EWH70_27805 [Amycolatopsis suaedae]
MSRLSRALEGLRQRRYPGEFRIDPPRWPSPSETSTPQPAAPPADHLPDSALADIATNLWRGRRKLAQNGDGSRARRHLQAVFEQLDEAGVVIKDHDGTLYDPGLTLEVVAYEERSVPKATVVETVRPSVYRNGRCIQIGQVIVAQPGEGQTP